MFKLEFETDNAAFDDGNARNEIEQILQGIAESVFSADGGKVRDTNGNTIGSWSYTPPEAPELIVDGHETEDPESPLIGDGEFPPFWVFDATAQRNVAGPFTDREGAQKYIDEKS